MCDSVQKKKNQLLSDSCDRPDVFSQRPGIRSLRSGHLNFIGTISGLVQHAGEIYRTERTVRIVACTIQNWTTSKNMSSILRCDDLAIPRGRTYQKWHRSTSKTDFVSAVVVNTVTRPTRLKGYFRWSWSVRVLSAANPLFFLFKTVVVAWFRLLLLLLSSDTDSAADWLLLFLYFFFSSFPRQIMLCEKCTLKAFAAFFFFLQYVKGKQTNYYRLPVRVYFYFYTSR